VFCRRDVEDLRVRVADEASFPEVLFVHLGTVEAGERFFESHWPEARAVSDPDKVIYEAFGLGRASLSWVLGLRVWMPGLRALLSGHRIGRVTGDPHWSSGSFLVRDAVVAWEQRHAHSGDTPRWDEMFAVFRSEG